MPKMGKLKQIEEYLIGRLQDAVNNGEVWYDIIAADFEKFGLKKQPDDPIERFPYAKSISNFFINKGFFVVLEHNKMRVEWDMPTFGECQAYWELSFDKIRYRYLKKEIEDHKENGFVDIWLKKNHHEEQWLKNNNFVLSKPTNDGDLTAGETNYMKVWRISR